MDIYAEIERRAKTASSLEDSEDVLYELLRGGYSVWTDGRLYSIRQIVDRINGLQVHIYADEHAPPHFHIKSPDVDATFSIQDCTYLRGNIDGREVRLVEWWYRRSRPLLISVWNSTRPSDCQVGPINE